MTVCERVLAIRLLEQQEKKPEYFEKLGVQANMNEAESAITERRGLSQILCKHRNAVQIEQNLFKAEVAQAAAALFSK